jgi:hypothetical protein
VKPAAVFLPLLLLAATSTLPGQSPSTPSTPSSPAAVKPAATTPAKPAVNPAKAAADAKAAKIAAKKARKAEVQLKPFSAVGFGAGMSLMGVNLQAATNVNRYLNLRGTGNFFDYTANNISTNGFSLNGKVNFATAGVSLDYYPIPRMGFRVSPGMLLYNENGITATATPQPGKSFSLDGYDYYPEAGSSTPFQVNANLGLNTHKQAFTLTTGWGNMIPRKRKDLLIGHLSFPFEIGAAFTGVPTINMQLQGYACDSNGANCVNMATDPTAQSNLNAQVAKWRSDLNPLQVYPIFSFGVAYSIRTK